MIAPEREDPVDGFPSELSSEESDRQRLDRTWRTPPGLIGWLSEESHSALGRRFIVTAFVFFALGGIEAALMRIQLARPENDFLGPDLYNQIFTMHGSTMMFLFAVPIVTALGLYLVPLMIGTRNMAFPRLSNFSYWTYLTGGVLLYVSFLLDMGPDAGWFAYTPLSGPEFSPGKRVDVWAQMITFTEISALAGAVNMIATIFKQRAPGMSLNRMPLFVWAQLVTAFMIVFAMPAVMLDSGFLALDRLVDTHFFNHAEGGDSLLWQHLFWFFGHPEVYIIFLPALGIVSSVVVAFSRRTIFGYLPMVLSLVATAFIGFGLWVHHMFATGLPQLGQSFFTAASIMIAVPSGVQIFCWIATLWSSPRLRFRTPLLYVLGFFAIFVLGGLSGVMLASVPLDLQVHDTYFVVAHFHYVLIGGSLFPLLGGVYFWLPKMIGRMYNEKAGKLGFWLTFIGFNVVFFPLHQVGLQGMPRRVYTYPAGMGWEGLNILSTAGAVVLALGILTFFLNVLWARSRGPLAGDDPWGADTLEWSTSSPPPPYNFFHLPTVQGRYPLWTPPDQPRPVVVGLSTEKREVLVTNLLDAEPDHRAELPEADPLALCPGDGDRGDLRRRDLQSLGSARRHRARHDRAGRLVLAAAPLQGAAGGAAMTQRPQRPQQPVIDVSSLPTFAFGPRDPLWWGVAAMIAIETTMFALTAVTYFYLRGGEIEWPPPGARMPMGLGWANVVILLASLWPMHLANREALAMKLRPMRFWLLVATVLGLAALGLRAMEMGGMTFRWNSHAYGSIVWTIFGLHTLHLLTSCGENLVFLAVLYRGPVEKKHCVDMRLNGMYWFFVVLSWLPLFALFYLDPGMLGK